MSFLFADRKKQIAVVNITGNPSNSSSMMVTGSIDLLNHASVTGLANATLVGNLTEAANLVYPTSRGSLTYYNGLVVEGLPHVAISPEVGSVDPGTYIRDKGVGIGLGYTVSTTTRLYNKPTAVLDIMASNADVKITGGNLSTAGTASMILVGSKAASGIISGFKMDVQRTTPNVLIDEATLYLRPYKVTEDLPSIVTVTHDGNIGIGTSVPQTKFDVRSVYPDSAMNITSTGGGLQIETTTGVGTPLKVISNGGDSLVVANNGKVGVGTDPTGISSNTDFSMYVNGPIRSDNSIFAYGTFAYNSNGIFEKKDMFNVNTITANSTSVIVTFLDAATEFNTSLGYTIVVSENSSNPIKAYVSARTAASVTFQFINTTTGAASTFTEFSFMLFYNPNSSYKLADSSLATF